MELVKKYCASPWRGLHLNFEGQIQTCCAAHPNMLSPRNDDDTLIKVNRSIESVLQGEVIKEIRSTIKKGILHPKYCYNCIKNENAGFASEREWHNNISPDFDCTTAELDDHTPALIDVRWGSSWQQLDKNVTTVSQRMQNSQQHGGIQAVYTIYNCTRLCELKKYAEDKNITITWQHVHGDQLDPHKHNSAIKELAVAEIKRYRDNFDLRPAEADWAEQQLLQFGNRDDNQSKELLQFTEDIENKWHPDQKGQFAKLWPEIAKAL